MNAPNLHHRRYTFLNALRYGPIPFWQSLNTEVWLSRDPERLRFWLAERGIVDRWFIEDAIIPTLQEWERDPNLGNARLEPEYRWFYYSGGGDQVQPFAPAGSFGLPRYSGPLNADDVALRGTDEQRRQIVATTTYEGGPYNEMLPRFFRRIEAEDPEVRRRGAYHDDWVRHKRYLRSLAESDQNLVRHAEWTALLWSGTVTPMEIARKWQYPRLRRRGQPDKLVLMAVRRFADSISLTMKR